MILKKGRLASLRAVRRGLGVAAGYLSSGTLWGGFEFRIASRKPRSSGLARSGAILPLSAARLANVAPNASFWPATVAARRSRRTGGSLCPASYHNTAQLLPSDSRMFSLEIPLDLASGEYGDVYFGLLPKTRKHLNGPPLSTRASLHARPWSEVDREAQQISCPSKQREALAPTKNCVSAASLMNSRHFIIR
jgi:hypothetical protein